MTSHVQVMVARSRAVALELGSKSCMMPAALRGCLHANGLPFTALPTLCCKCSPPASCAAPLLSYLEPVHLTLHHVQARAGQGASAAGAVRSFEGLMTSPWKVGADMGS